MSTAAERSNTPAPLAQASLGQASIVPKAAEQVWAAIPDGESVTGSSPTLAAVEPTQVRRPWRSTARTVFQALVGLAAALPILVKMTGLDVEDIPWLATVLAGAAVVTKAMAHPQTERFLRRFLPFLAAAPGRSDQKKKERRHDRQHRRRQ